MRYNVLHRIPVMNNFIKSAAEGKGAQVELHWATVRPGWSPSEWEAERELRLQFAKTFVPVDSWQAANKLEAARTAGRPHKSPVLGLEIFGALLAGIVFFAHLYAKQSGVSPRPAWIRRRQREMAASRRLQETKRARRERLLPSHRAAKT